MLSWLTAHSSQAQGIFWRVMVDITFCIFTQTHVAGQKSGKCSKVKGKETGIHCAIGSSGSKIERRKSAPTGKGIYRSNYMPVHQGYARETTMLTLYLYSCILLPFSKKDSATHWVAYIFEKHSMPCYLLPIRSECESSMGIMLLCGGSFVDTGCEAVSAHPQLLLA